MDLVSMVITKIKKENYSLDKNIHTLDMFGILRGRLMQALRGIKAKIFFHKTKGITFIGKRVRFVSARNISCGSNLIIEDGCYINALSVNGMEIGDNVSIGRNSIIECTGVIRELGCGIKIGNNVGISPNAFIAARGFIEIGDNTIFGPGVSIHSENHSFSDKSIPIRKQPSIRKGVKIGNDCWIGSKSIILDDVEIGNGVVVAAGAVITKSIPDFAVVGGVPAKVLKFRGN